MTSSNGPCDRWGTRRVPLQRPVAPCGGRTIYVMMAGVRAHSPHRPRPAEPPPPDTPTHHRRRSIHPLSIRIDHGWRLPRKQDDDAFHPEGGPPRARRLTPPPTTDAVQSTHYRYVSITGGGYRGRRTTMSSTPRAGRTGPFALAHPLPLTDPGSDGSPRAGSALTRRAVGAAAATGMLALSGSGDQLSEKLLQIGSSRTLPDLLMLDNPDVQQVAASGALAPLEQYGITTEGITDSVADLGMHDGSLYGIAPTVNTIALFYNV